jgi:AcrR family transcriptional regulator
MRETHRNSSSGPGLGVPRRRASPEERRSQILAAALGCFSKRGFHATTMDQIVASSGLSKGALYWHFESKEDVFLGCIDHLAGEIFGRVDAAAGTGGDGILTILHRELERFLERFGAERALLLAWVEFLSHPRGRERIAELYSSSRERFARLIREGVGRGELRDLSPDGAAAVLTGTLDAMLLQAAVDPAFDARRYTETLWEVLRGGLAVRP